MTNAAKRSDAVACGVAYTEAERPYTWLEDYLERLEGKDAYREFHERYYGRPEYCTLVASLAA